MKKEKTKKEKKPIKYITTIELDSETKKMLSDIKKIYGVNKGAAIKQGVKRLYNELINK